MIFCERFSLSARIPNNSNRCLFESTLIDLSNPKKSSKKILLSIEPSFFKQKTIKTNYKKQS